MNQRVVRNLLIGMIGLATAAGAGYGAYQWQSTRPSEANFDKAMRALFEKGPADPFGRPTGDVVREACVTIPLHPAPDARSKSSQPLAWHLDFLVDAPATAARAQQLRQLDALTKVGLLARAPAAIELNGEIKAVNRYSLTESGWAASGSERRSSCLVYGTPQYLGITRFAPKAVSAEAGLEVYEVHGKAGFRSAGELRPWARDPDVMAAFPEIREHVAGKDLSVLLVRGGGNWVEYQSLLRSIRPGRADAAQLGEAEREAMARLEKERDARIAEASKLAPPTVDEVKSLLSARYGPGADRTWPSACLELPGNEKLPVDKKLSTYRPAHYAVALFQNKERKSYDRVASKTLPYLDMLERLGVVSKREESNVPGERRDNGAVFFAHVYELSPAYAGHLDPEHGDCFPLGEPTVEFVDVRVAEPDHEWSVNPRVSYKFRIRYRNPPDWMRDPALLAGWDELRNALERGRACGGRFEFDKAKRELMAGGGSCWWAFDSYYENH